MQPHELQQLAVAILMPLLGGVVVSSCSDRTRWYHHTHKKPAWAPPSWLLAPIWTLLYVSMGQASWLVWRKGGITQQGTALALYCCTVGLTYAWPVLSFGLHRMDWALAEAVVLLAAEAGTFVAFSGVIGLPLALLLLGPLLVWTSFATVLNYALLKGQGSAVGGAAAAGSKA